MLDEGTRVRVDVSVQRTAGWKKVGRGEPLTTSFLDTPSRGFDQPAPEYPVPETGTPERGHPAFAASAACNMHTADSTTSRSTVKVPTGRGQRRVDDRVPHGWQGAPCHPRIV